MIERFKNWFRGFRLDMAHKIMDRRDLETVLELGAITRDVVNTLSWKLVNDIRQGRVRVVETSDAYYIIYENERVPLH